MNNTRIDYSRGVEVLTSKGKKILVKFNSYEAARDYQKLHPSTCIRYYLDPSLQKATLSSEAKAA